MPPLQHSVSVNANTKYDSNPSMATENIRGVFVNTVVPRYQVRYVNGVNEVTAAGQMTVVRTSDQDLVIDREDPTARLGWKRELQRGEINAAVDYDKESTSSSEPTTSGSSGSNDTRAHYGVSGSVKYEISQRMEADISISKDYYTYSTSSGLVSSFGNYDTTTSMVTLTYLLNQRNAVYTRVGATKYTPDTPGADSTVNNTAVVGVKTDLTPNISADANVGAARLDTAGSPTSAIGAASLTYNGKRTTASVNYSRSSSSSGSSSFTQTDDVSASVTYAVDDRSNIGATASMSSTIAENPTTSSSVEVFADRQMIRDLTARASYQYRRNESVGDTETTVATGSSVMLSVNYDLPDL